MGMQASKGASLGRPSGALTSWDRARTFSPLARFPMQLKRYSEADLPTVHGPFRLIVYREAMEGVACANPICTREHMAVVRGNIGAKANVLCRVHSECWTAEVMGSLKCDCREQFHTAMERIAAEGSGAVVYLRQEGRGIGLGNKRSE